VDGSYDPFTRASATLVERAVARGTTSPFVNIGMISLTFLHRAYRMTVGGMQRCCRAGHVCNKIANKCARTDRDVPTRTPTVVNASPNRYPISSPYQC